MKPAVKYFLAGVASALAITLLLVLFLAYQQPALLFEWSNLRYCG